MVNDIIIVIIIDVLTMFIIITFFIVKGMIRNDVWKLNMRRRKLEDER